MSIFGQNPADITGALFKAKNLADLPDKDAARTNLDVPSKAEVQYNSVPVGMILPFWGSVAPVGYVPCSGQTVTSASFPELVTFLGGGTSQTVPDLRGEFLRGWDNGRGVDVGRAIKTLQLDMFKSHTHGTKINVGAAGGGFTTIYNSGTQNDTTDYIQSTGGVETRPRNVSVLYCIKAYSSVTNVTSGLNLAGLVNDYSTLSAAAVKYADFTGTNQILSANGYQKLPGGLIFQWGTSSYVSGVKAIVFPTTFLNGVFSVNAGLIATGAANYSSSTSSAVTLSGFTTYQNSPVSSPFYWQAIGY